MIWLFSVHRRRMIPSLLVRTIIFVLSMMFLFPAGYGVTQGLSLPDPGTMLKPSPPLTPPLLKGVAVYPDDPFTFDFIVSPGDSSQKLSSLQKETLRMIKYFLASLTIPDKDRWVNLSPYEQYRIIPENFARTDMGQDLLAQDYLLKQITASFLYPEEPLGASFWQRVYHQAYQRYGTTEIPLQTFHKIWVVPEKAVIYEQVDKTQNRTTAVVLEQRLKVLLEQDYMAQKENREEKYSEKFSGYQSDLMREIILPAIEKEVNTGKTFARLRQIYQAVILAAWYRRYLKEGLLGRVYMDKGKTKGLEPQQDERSARRIYQKYMSAFRQGVFNYIKEEKLPGYDRKVPRKYFAGGVKAVIDPKVMTIKTQETRIKALGRLPVAIFSVKTPEIGPEASLQDVNHFQLSKGSSPIRPQDYQPVPEYWLRKIKSSLITPKIYLSEIDQTIDLEHYLSSYSLYYQRSEGLSDPVVWEKGIYLNIQGEDYVDEVAYLFLQAVFSDILDGKEKPEDHRQKVMDWMDMYFHRVFRSEQSSYLTYIVGGTGGKFVSSFKKIFAKVRKGSVTFIVSPFDDGGGSRRLMDELKNFLGYWTPPAGDQMNIISGLTTSSWGDLIRQRVYQEDPVYAEARTLSQVIQIFYEQRKRNSLFGDISLFNKIYDKLEPYVVFMDDYLRQGKISLHGQSVGNLIHAAVMLKEQVYGSKELDQVLYQRAMDILMDIFDVDNVTILLSSFEEATLYAQLKFFEVGSAQNPLREALRPDGGWIDVGGLHVSMRQTEEHQFVLRVKEYPEYRLVLQERFGSWIRWRHDNKGDNSQTFLRVYHREQEVDVRVLPVDGKDLDVRTKDFHLKIKGRLVIGQTHITDNLHHSAPIRLGFVNNKKPQVNPLVLEVFKKTEGMIAAGPGSYLTSRGAVLMTEGILNHLKDLNQRGRIPIVWVENPVRDNETVGMSYRDLWDLTKEFLGGPLSDFFNLVVLNRKEDSWKRMSSEEKRLLDEYASRKDRFSRYLFRRPEDVSYVAKFRRGFFEGDSQRYARFLKTQGLDVVYIDALRQIDREGRAESASVTVGFSLDKLAEIFEDIIYEKNTKEGIYWKALIGEGLSESIILRMLHEISLIYPNMSFAERVKFLYEIRTSDDKKTLGLPLFDVGSLKHRKADLLVLNFAGTQGYAGIEQQRKVSGEVIEAYEGFLEANPSSRILIRTGVGFQELQDLLLRHIPDHLRHRLIVASNSGAVVYGFAPRTGKPILRKKEQMPLSVRKKIRAIIDQSVRYFGFDKVVKNTFGEPIAQPIDSGRIREREAQFVVELQEYMMHPILRRLTKDPHYSHVAQEFADYLNRRFQQEKLSFSAEVVGIGAVNIIAKNISSLQDVIHQVLDADFGRKIPPEHMLFLGHGFAEVAQMFKGATYIVFGASQELFQGAKMYPLLGPAGFTNLLIRLSESKQQRIDRLKALRRELRGLQKVDLIKEIGVVKRVFQSVKAWRDPYKRGLLFFLLRQGTDIIRQDETLVFRDISGIRVSEGELWIDPRLYEKVREKTQNMIFADMDENLAPRKSVFSQEMSAILTEMIAYGMITPNIITDNGFEAIGPRLQGLPEAIRHEMPIYADGSGNKYVAHPVTGEYHRDEDFQKRMRTRIDPQTYEMIQQKFFGAFVAHWRPFLLNMARVLDRFKTQRGGYPLEEDIPQIIYLLSQESILEETHYDRLLSMAVGSLGQEISRIIQNREERVRLLAQMTEDLRREGTQEEDILCFHQLIALKEIIRLLHATDPRDQKEKKDILAHYLTLTEEGWPVKDKGLRLFFRGGVQIPLSPLRPRLLRDLYVHLWVPRFNDFKSYLSEGEDLVLYPGGMTTINIKNGKVNKAVPVAYAINVEKIPSGMVEFSGDEYRQKQDSPQTRRPDDAVALLQEKFPELIVRNTAQLPHDRQARAGVLMSQDLDVSYGLHGPQANAALYRVLILSLEATLRDLLIQKNFQVPGLMERYRRQLGLNTNISASSSSVDRKETVGGIDLNLEFLDLQIRRDSMGRPLALEQQPLDHMRVTGLFPIIVHVIPKMDLSQFLGL